ncbi:MAG TPA: IPT/TIG domain-containing protein, partial [Algoriphagus sp.]|nr:IPT/TIG domain-containing protein [Algoriphagus sp.]
MQRFFLLGFFLILLAGWACTQEEDATTVVTTEEVVFVSGEKIRVLGRLITNQPITALDHGFQLSTTESFSNPIMISLGEKKGPGRFIGETTGLQINQNYFVRAFVNAAGTDFFGETLEVKTLLPAIESFSPSLSFPGEELMIVGRNFTPDTRVFFGEQEATVLEIAFDSRIKVRIPESSGKAKVPVIVQSQDQRLEANQPFEYRTGKYTLIGLYPENERIYDNVFFQDQNSFYVGLGTVKVGFYLENFLRFDPQTASWSLVEFPGDPRKGAFATSGYIGGGAEVDRDIYYYKRDFWKINGERFEQLPDLPIDTYLSTALELNGKLYVFGGSESAALSVLMFNPDTKIWSTQSAAPLGIQTTLAWFTYQNKAYVL